MPFLENFNRNAFLHTSPAMQFSLLRYRDSCGTPASSLHACNNFLAPVGWFYICSLSKHLWEWSALKCWILQTQTHWHTHTHPLLHTRLQVPLSMNQAFLASRSDWIFLFLFEWLGNVFEPKYKLQLWKQGFKNPSLALYLPYLSPWWISWQANIP